MADLSNIDLHDIGGHVEEACIHHHLNQHELARLSGVSQSTVCRLLNRKLKSPRTCELAKLLPFFPARGAS